jgi:GNAT superfamily N-acetyltransferase
MSLIPTKCKLLPINLHDTTQFDELRHQRFLCGWYQDHVSQWRDEMDAKLKSMFWIHAKKSAEDDYELAGHISLDSQASPPDPELANPDRSVMTISTFFVFPKYRSGGVGRAAVETLEGYATQEPYGSPKCKAIALTTVSRRYTEDDGEEWRGMYKKRGMEAPIKGRTNEDWYVRQGYVKFKEEPRIRERLLDGTEVILLASFLRKGLQ